MKKVVILTPFYIPSVGGAETFAYELYKESCKCAITCVITLPEKMQLEFKKNPFSGTGIKQLLQIFPKLLSVAVKANNKINFDTIHALGLNAAAVGLILKWLYRKKLIVTVLALYDFDGRSLISRMTRFILNRADMIFSEGETGKKDLINAGVKPAKIKTFNHWVDQDIFRPCYNHDKYLKVIFIGRAIPIKGISIIHKLREKLMSTDVVFSIVENIGYEYLPAFYKWADVLIVPSMYSEGFVRVVAEGASAGLAVLTSNCGALPEMVKDFGVTCNPCVKEFEDFLTDWHKNRRALYSLQKKSARYAKKHFNASNARSMIDEY